MTTLSDELLKQIAEGSGRTYSHEGKAMAQELIERRAKDRVLSLTPPSPNTAPSPYGWAKGTP